MSLKMLLAKGLYTIKDAAPVIFGAVAVVGVVATAVLAVKAGPKAADILRADIHPLTTFEKVKLTWKCYVPTMLCCTFTIGCIILSMNLSARKIKALAATCTALVVSRDGLEAKIKEVYGEDVLKDLKRKANEALASQVVANEDPEENLDISVEDTGQGDILCYESYSGRWFWSSQEAVDQAVIRFNDQLEADGSAGLNDFYYYLKISETRFGYERGWVNDELWYDLKDGVRMDCYWIDMGKGQPVYAIDILDTPMEDWMEV